MSIQSIDFGKLDSWDDFGRSANGSQLTQKLDEWMSQAINLMSDDPRWTLTYDKASSLRFAISLCHFGPAHPVALMGDPLCAPNRSTSLSHSCSCPTAPMPSCQCGGVSRTWA